MTNTHSTQSRSLPIWTRCVIPDYRPWKFINLKLDFWWICLHFKLISLSALLSGFSFKPCLLLYGLSKFRLRVRCLVVRCCKITSSSITHLSLINSFLESTIQCKIKNLIMKESSSPFLWYFVFLISSRSNNWFTIL